MSSFFASEEFTTAMDILKNQFPLAIWGNRLCNGAFYVFCGGYRLAARHTACGGGERKNSPRA